VLLLAVAAEDSRV